MDLAERTRAFIDRWNEAGPDALSPFLADDVVLVEREDNLERDTIHGKAPMIERYRDRVAVVGPSRASVRSVEQLDRARVMADFDLHFEGRVSGIEGELQMVHLYTWKDGFLARIEEFADTESARAAAQ